MQYAHLLTVTDHDDTVRQYTDVRYTHTGAGLTIETAGGEKLHVSAFDILQLHADHYCGGPQAMVPDPGEPPAEPDEPDDHEILAAYECPAGGLCDCRHEREPGGLGRWPRCPRCGCSCPLPDPDKALGDPDACPCCHYSPA